MPRLAANLSYLFLERPMPERFAAARAAGFRAVEFHFPYDHDIPTLAAAAKDAGVEIVLFNLPPGDWAGGERGIGCLPDRRAEFRAGVETAIAAARTLGCTRINCLAGLKPEGLPEQEARAVLIENLRHAAAAFAAHGLRLLLEPINTRDMPGFFVHRTAPALEILDAVGADNAFLQYDIYHAQVMEGDLAQTLSAHRDRIGHIQLADNPGRNEPGTGEINFPFLLNHIDRIGYEGWVGCEYRPATTTAAGLGWAKDLLEGTAARGNT